MPNSPFSTMTGIMGIIDMYRPKSVLDIGVGFGRAGFLIREYFDLRPDKKKGYADWSMRIDGIEIFEKYLTPVHDYIYNEIFIGDALSILEDSNFYYDMILALDVIEHFKKDDGLKFIELCKGRSKMTLVSTPYIYYRQGEEFFNKYETHLSGWDASDFKLGGCRFMWRHDISIIAAFADSGIDLPLSESIEDNYNDPNELHLIKDLISMYFNTQQFSACIGTCSKYISLLKDDHETLLILALCYEKEGDTVKSRKYAEAVLDINGEEKAARNILDRISR
jgi:hypothetical protein